ncbi:MAG: hypothetical protein WC559_00275 [Candidatus Omnitrophota bacterium]
MKNKMVLILALCIVFTGAASSLLWAKPAEVADTGGIATMPVYSPSLGVTIPAIQKTGETDIKVQEISSSQQGQGNGTIEVGDTVVFDGDFTYYTRNENPINNYGGAYVQAQTPIPEGTTFEVVSMGSYTVSNFQYEGKNLLTDMFVELGIGYQQIELKVLDGPMAGQTVYGLALTNDFVGFVAGLVTDAPTMSEAK